MHLCVCHKCVYAINTKHFFFSLFHFIFMKKNFIFAECPRPNGRRGDENGRQICSEFGAYYVPPIQYIHAFNSTSFSAHPVPSGHHSGHSKAQIKNRNKYTNEANYLIVQTKRNDNYHFSSETTFYCCFCARRVFAVLIATCGRPRTDRCENTSCMCETTAVRARARAR